MTTCCLLKLLAFVFLLCNSFAMGAKAFLTKSVTCLLHNNDVIAQMREGIRVIKTIKEVGSNVKKGSPLSQQAEIYRMLFGVLGASASSGGRRRCVGLEANCERKDLLSVIYDPLRGKEISETWSSSVGDSYWHKRWHSTENITFWRPLPAHHSNQHVDKQDLLL